MSARHLRTHSIEDVDDATIATAVEQLSVPALMASVVQITGNPSYIRGPIRPVQFVQNEFQGSLDDASKARLRRDALQAICAWRDAGCPPTQPLSTDVIRELMDWIACEPVPDDNAALYLEEMDLHGANPRAIAKDGLTPPPGFSVLIIGLGASGLLAAIRLKEAGIPFAVVEKNPDVGGTWFENSYPGCRVDVASHFYSYSFEHVGDFSSYYTRQPELHAYFRAAMTEHGIDEYVSWGREAERAQWDEEAGQWSVMLRSADGSAEQRTASAVISGVGFLNRPMIPDLPGLKRFSGPVFHSAQWDHSVDLRGKRVALVGAGASGFQIGPAIVDEVAELVVFQRTPQWMAPNPRYHAPVGDGERWAMRHLPGYSRWYRFMLMWQSSDKMLELVRADPDWHDFPRTANETSAARREFFVKWINDQVGDIPDLAAKVTPDYPPMAKRMLQDNGSWLRCLRREHVTFVNDRITVIDEHSVGTATDRYEVDVILLATGFRAAEVLCPLEVIGRGGVPISQVWGGKPGAFNGVSVTGFPNFFMMAGPGTALAHAGSVIFMLECQMRYIGAALRTVIEQGRRTIEPTAEAYARYNRELQDEVATLMWGHPSIEHSWYKSPDGGVYVLCPFGSVEYWKRTGVLDEADHLLG